jgi:glycine/D-amino acid oxidase-like deaminating enzyme
MARDHVPHILWPVGALYRGLGFSPGGVAMATMFGKVLAGHCVGNPTDDHLPLTPLSKTPFNRFRTQGITIALTWKRLLDATRP